MPAGKQDYYSLLGVGRDATLEEIRRAYFEAAQKLHPDKNTAAGETEIFLEVQQAYEVLANSIRRAKYDATLGPEEKITLPYDHKILFSRPNLIRLQEPQMLYVLLELQAPLAARQSPAPPLNVCLVLDRSTSMQGEKMDVVKSAAIQVLRNLRPQDILSVVTFSDRAEVVIPASLYQERSRLEAKIQMIKPSGATEIYQGLEAGVKEVMRSLDSRRVNHLVLLTDGHTYGDEQQCLALASKVAGVCGVMQQMATFQKSTQMPGGDKFIERFWKTEFARLGKSQETFFRECEGAIAIYDKIMATQNPPKQ